MAGMFYSLKETALQLGKTEDQVKQLVKEGKLREFRDGANLLFKIDEVNSLQSEGVDMALDGVGGDDGVLQDLGLEEAPAADLLEEAPEETPLADEDLFKLDEEPATLEPTAEVEATSELGLAPEEAPTDADAIAGDDLLLLSGEEQPATADGTADFSADTLSDDLSGSSEEISLASESGVLASGSDITDMDTAITSAEGVNVLGESSTDFNVTEDSMAETAVGPAGSGAEASLEEIEDDVNLDNFGSGSGLLDLSLQADDTSLGGILDEIYTSEGGEAGAEGESSDAEPAAIGDEGASFDDITAEADHPAGAEEELPVPEPVAIMPAAVGAMYAEPEPDAQSNILGMLLFLPMLALLYTAIVAIAGLRGVMPSVLSSIQGFVWYLLGGAIVASLVVVGVSFMAGRDRSASPVRTKKEKIKAEKPAKEKTSKAEKSAKAEKPAKEKKSFFGKKK